MYVDMEPVTNFRLEERRMEDVGFARNGVEMKILCSAGVDDLDCEQVRHTNTPWRGGGGRGRWGWRKGEGVGEGEKGRWGRGGGGGERGKGVGKEKGGKKGRRVKQCSQNTYMKVLIMPHITISVSGRIYTC